MILSHFPPLHVHSIMSLMGVNMPICSLLCHCYSSNTPLHLCCESKVHILVSQWLCMLAHLEFFVEGVSCIFYCYCNPSCIKLGLSTLIDYLFFCLLCCNHHLCSFFGFIFLLLPSRYFIVLFCCWFVNFVFCKIPKYSIEVITCDLK